MLEVIGRSLAIGIGATALLDLWALVLNRAFGIPLANWAMVGRWFAYLPRGHVREVMGSVELLVTAVEKAQR